jgi:hypothetical protein
MATNNCNVRMSRSRSERLSIVSSFAGRRAGPVPASDGLLKNEKIEPVPGFGPFQQPIP